MPCTDKFQHTSHPVPVAEGSVDMKTLWVLLTIGLTFAEKLNRSYLPPPGATFSGGSPGAITVPVEFPKTKYSYDEGLPKIPDLAIGIDRVAPNQVVKKVEDTLTAKPQRTYNDNSFASPTKAPSYIFKQSSPFSSVDSYSTTIPTISFDLENPSNDLSPIFPINTVDKAQQLYKYANISALDKPNQAYLPPYPGNIERTADNTFSALLLPVNNENETTNEQGNNEYTSSLNQIHQPHIEPSELSPNYPENFNNNLSPNNISPSNFDYYPPTTPISISNKLQDRIQDQSDRQAVILNYEQFINPEGYGYNYDTSNGIHAHESGTATDGVKAKGSYSYIGDDGNVYHIAYTADENGFRPKGAHLPTSPPIPDAILKVIEQAAKEKEAGIYDDGSYNEEKYGHKKYQEQYPQKNNIVSRVNPSLGNNENNLKKGEQINEYKLRVQNELDSTIENHVNEFGHKIDTTAYNRNYDNDEYQNNTSPNQNTIFNKNNYEKSLPENINLRKNYFELSQLPNDVVGANIDNSSHKYPLFSYNKSIPNTNDNMKPHITSGYQYFLPEAKFYDRNIDAFPPRFSGNDKGLNMQHTDRNRSITEKVTAKPFLTPYVPRKDDDLEIYDCDDYSFENKHQDNYEDPVKSKFLQNSIGPKYDQSTNSYIDSRKFISGEQQGIEDKLEDSNHIVPSGDGGYFYKNAHQPFITVAPKMFYTTSKTMVTEFPPRFSTTDINDFKSYATENDEAPVKNLSMKNLFTPLQTLTMRPVYLVNESESTYPHENDKSGFISTARAVQSSAPDFRSDDVRFGTSYRSSTETTPIPVIYNDETITEDILGEDFIGPKQLQLFDPINGYHY